jgi:UDP:flavonoid glycosyltransferase YjiC (YdhE family)
MKLTYFLFLYSNKINFLFYNNIYSIGLPTTGPKQEWQAFNQTVRTAQYDVWKGFSDYVVSRGLPPLPDHSFINHSKYLNIYGFPLELDYLDMRPLPPKWYRFDNLKRTEREPKFEIPVPLTDKPGKLVYFSMGSMGGADVENMQRLVTILSKSKHRFIVSKGPKHMEYDLGDNMWGAATVPQMQVLPVVDLVVTHGGNNTITETMYFGKPVVVLPLFEDQWDNAQRVHELGFGIRLDAYQCSERELLTAIDRLLSDKALNERLRKVSQRIQSDNSIAKLPEMIAKLVDNNLAM